MQEKHNLLKRIIFHREVSGVWEFCEGEEIVAEKVFLRQNSTVFTVFLLFIHLWLVNQGPLICSC